MENLFKKIFWNRKLFFGPLLIINLSKMGMKIFETLFFQLKFFFRIFKIYFSNYYRSITKPGIILYQKIFLNQNFLKHNFNFFKNFWLLIQNKTLNIDFFENSSEISTFFSVSKNFQNLEELDFFNAHNFNSW